MRPQRGSRATSTTGASTCWTPRARVWRAATVKICSSNGGSNVAARPIACGKLVPPGATKPCSDSSCNSAGIPRRVFSIKNFWMALAKAIAPRASWRSLGRVISPMPSDISFLARDGDSSCVLGSSIAFLSQLTLPSCATFSPSVIWPSRSAIRLSTGSFGSRYGAAALAAEAGANVHPQVPGQSSAARPAASVSFVIPFPQRLMSADHTFFPAACELANLPRMSTRAPGVFALLSLSFAVAGGACIMRTPASPSSGASGTSGAPAAAAAPAPSAATVAAEERIAGLPRVDLLGGAGVAAFKPQGEVVKVDVAPIAVTGQPFTDAVRATVKEGSGHEWAVQLVAETTAPVDSGDAVLATFFLRTEVPQEGGVGETEFVFELNGSPYTKSIQYPVQGAAGWSKIEVRFKAARAYAAGEAHVIFRLGYDRQTIEIGGAKVESFGQQIAFSALPATQAADRKREHEAAAAAKAKAAAEAALPPNEGG